jgi:hypothetical protein
MAKKRRCEEIDQHAEQFEGQDSYCNQATEHKIHENSSDISVSEHALAILMLCADAEQA